MKRVRLDLGHCAAGLLVAAITFGASTSSAQPLPFFSGAEGYGGSWSGTPPAGGWLSNATVYHVTNLNDSGPGSLRGAFVENSSNKIIVFDVAGTINLTSDNLDIKNLSNYYIAGQTAPGPVTIYGDMAQLTHSSGKENRNIVLRYLSFRKGTGDNSDSITFAGSGLGTNMILDHVSASWSEDEVLSVANNNTNVTVQYSIIHDALVNNHAYGSLIRPRIDSNVTFHHNLYAHNASRQARFGTYDARLLQADFRNNVVYNWRDRASYAGGSSEDEQEFADINYVGNYLVAGPGTLSNANRAFHVDKNIDARVYQSGNFIDSDRQLNPGGQPNGADTGWGMFVVSTPITDQTLTQMATPFAAPAVTTQFAPDAYWQVLNHVGNFWWQRDAIDARVINNVLTNTNTPSGIAAAAPNAAELNALLNAPIISRPAGWDSDNDGMPDVWEVAHGLNPASAADNKLDFDNDGYINLLEYLDEAGAFPAPAPIVFQGGTNNRYAVITNWKTNDGGVTSGSHWQPSRFDEARINNGTIVVDAVGQHAGVLKLGTESSQTAFVISNGWLDVADELVIGEHPNAFAFVTLSGGVLNVPTINKNANSSFTITGGVLHAENVNFDLVNEGGVIAPGNSYGQTHIGGDLTLEGGALQIEIGSLAAFDTLLVDGTATLGGNLDVVTLDGFTPSLGDNWPILAADALLGQFGSVTNGYSAHKDGNTLRLYFGPGPSVGLTGDFNDDGTVDAADYLVWRKGFGTTYSQDDYDDWQANFGTTSSNASGATSSASAVPEPAAWMLFLLAALGCQALRRTARICFGPGMHLVPAGGGSAPIKPRLFLTFFGQPPILPGLGFLVPGGFQHGPKTSALDQRLPDYFALPQRSWKSADFGGAAHLDRWQQCLGRRWRRGQLEPCR